MKQDFSPITTARDTVGAFLHEDAILVPPTGSGPLDGLTCGVKDLFDIRGHRTGYGNPTWRSTHAPAKRHAPAAQAILDGGAHVVGKTHTDELAFSLTGENFHYGAPLNTAAPGHITGGSSSGSAAAVAAGLCDFALGTDTGGSVRAPASFCGLFGFRPTYAAVSSEGVCRLAPSFDTVGWFARSARVLEAVGDVLLPADRAVNQPGSIGFPEEIWQSLDAGNAGDIREEGLAVARRLGEVQPVPLAPSALDAWFESFRTVQFHEVAQELGPWLDAHKPVLGPGIAERIDIARRLTASQIDDATKARMAVRGYMDQMLERHSLLVLPTVPGAAPRRGLPIESMERYRRTAMRFLCIAGLAGLPQVSIPMLRADGLPLGLSLIGRPGADRELLALVARMFTDPQSWTVVQ
ncbi:amidase [Variovorax sp. VNK109]|uniref:amidase n=1 Tax=Variovorax sp. VNK109 TaxID=3400919 RepID=UPI003BFEAFFB